MYKFTLQGILMVRVPLSSNKEAVSLRWETQLLMKEIPYQMLLLFSFWEDDNSIWNLNVECFIKVSDKEWQWKDPQATIDGSIRFSLLALQAIMYSYHHGRLWLYYISSFNRILSPFTHQVSSGLDCITQLLYHMNWWGSTTQSL